MPLACPVVVKAVVVAPKVAELVYNANLKVSPPEFLKLCTASRSSFLKLVVKVELIAISNSSNNLLEGSNDFNAIYKSILDSGEENSFKAVKKEYSEYVKGWQTRIEKYGTSFFPEELTDANIYGNVTMTVKINKLGEIISVNVINSSGYEVLDNVAKKILFSVGEYEPFPRNLAIHADTISISRIWSFKKKSININKYE